MIEIDRARTADMPTAISNKACIRSRLYTGTTSACRRDAAVNGYRAPEERLLLASNSLSCMACKLRVHAKSSVSEDAADGAKFVRSLGRSQGACFWVLPPRWHACGDRHATASKGPSTVTAGTQRRIFSNAAARLGRPKRSLGLRFVNCLSLTELHCAQSRCNGT